MAEAIDKKYLTGLKYKGSNPKKTEEGVKHIPFERNLKVEDVLDWKDNGATVTIVTADGAKYTVEKAAAAKAEKAADAPKA